MQTYKFLFCAFLQETGMRRVLESETTFHAPQRDAV